MDGQQHMGIRPPGKAFSACLSLSFLARSSPFLSFLPLAHFHVFALLFFCLLLLSLATSVLPHVVSLPSHLFHLFSLTVFGSPLSPADSISRCQRASYSILHDYGSFYHHAPLFFVFFVCLFFLTLKYLAEAVWSLCGDLSVSCAACAPSTQ